MLVFFVLVALFLHRSNAQCITTQPGFNCSGTTLSPCAPGTFSAIGGACAPCPQGWFAGFGQSTCFQCVRIGVSQCFLIPIFLLLQMPDYISFVLSNGTGSWFLVFEQRHEFLSHGNLQCHRINVSHILYFLSSGVFVSKFPWDGRCRDFDTTDPPRGLWNSFWHRVFQPRP